LVHVAFPYTHYKQPKTKHIERWAHVKQHLLQTKPYIIQPYI